MRRRSLLTVTLIASLGGCAETSSDPREALIAGTLAAADLALIRARPGLVAGRYARMASAPYEFFRGALPLYLRDWRDGSMSLSRSRFALDWPQPVALGDPHPENFGTLLGADGSLRLEANDLDAVDRHPYLWDLRRLTVGLCVAAELANADDPAAQALSRGAAGDVARAAAESYAQVLGAISRGASVEPILDGAGSPLLEDLFRRARRDADRRAELGALTALRDGRRALRRGVIDADDPAHVLLDLPPLARDALAPALARYRDTLREPPAERYFDVLDAARELGSGVASWPRVRALVLVRGPSDAADDDVVLEVKEEADPSTPGALPPGVWWSSVTERVLGARAVWSRVDADPLWGASSWVGLAVQVRAEREAHKTVRVARMTGAAGAVGSLVALARALGGYLARVHLAPAPDGERAGPSIAAVIARDPAGFAEEQAEVSTAYARVVLDDWRRFRNALAALGPTLGLTPDPADAPSPDLRALLALDHLPRDGGSP